jgi:cytochrome c oxidase cbb3-type subunit 3
MTKQDLITAVFLVCAATAAQAQQPADPNVNHGPKDVTVSGLFPGGNGVPTPDPTGKSYDGNAKAIAAGKKLFSEMNCNGCHFNGGGGIGPALMSGDWRYGGQIDQIYESISQGRPNGMPSWQAVLQPANMWDLAAYAKSLAENAAKAK